MLATYLGSLSGTLFLLQGQEIGMANLPREWGIEDYIDVEGKNFYDAVLKQRGEGADMSDVMEQLRLKARDNGRQLMQWDGSPNAGFSEGEKPWMRVNDDFKKWNVENQVKQEDSVLSYWKEVLTLRKKEKDVFVYGRFEMVPVEESGEDIFAYTMSSTVHTKKALVALNFSDRKKKFGGNGFEGWRKLIGGTSEQKLGKGGFTLQAYEGVIFSN
jgi:alpha-glucosidase